MKHPLFCIPLQQGVLLLDKYNVNLNDQLVGSVQIHKKGLFYCVRCRCNVNEKALYRLIAICDGRMVDLGICVPFYDGFGVDTMIKAEKIEAKELRFLLKDSSEHREGQFYPLSEEEPFENMELIMNTRFEKRGDICGLIIDTTSHDAI